MIMAIDITELGQFIDGIEEGLDDGIVVVEGVNDNDGIEEGVNDNDG